MIQKISAPISTTLSFNHKTRVATPKRMYWDGKIFQISQIGLHHTIREGRVLYHIFSVVSGDTFFRLKLNTENLSWTLEEISDGLPN